MDVRAWSRGRDSAPRSEWSGGSARRRHGMARRLVEERERMANRRPSKHREGQCSTPLRMVSSRPTGLSINSNGQLKAVPCTTFAATFESRVRSEHCSPCHWASPRPMSSGRQVMSLAKRYYQSVNEVSNQGSQGWSACLAMRDSAVWNRCAYGFKESSHSQRLVSPQQPSPATVYSPHSEISPTLLNSRKYQTLTLATWMAAFVPIPIVVMAALFGGVVRDR
jgi:hypothetical protein